MKKELNDVKNNLNNFDLSHWHRHTRATNPAGSVIWRVKQEVNPELLTQASS